MACMDSETQTKSCEANYLTAKSLYINAKNFSFAAEKIVNFTFFPKQPVPAVFRMRYIHRTAENYGEGFNVANWRFYGKSQN